MCGVFLEPANELLRARGVPQVYRRQLDATVDEVRVAIGESRHDETAAGPKNLRLGTDVARDRRRVTDREDLAVRNRDRAGLAASRREAGPHRAALNDDVGLAASASGEEHESDKTGEQTTHGDLLAQLGDSTNCVEGGDRIRRLGFLRGR